jgi:hypothetical protein
VLKFCFNLWFIKLVGKFFNAVAFRNGCRFCWNVNCLFGFVLGQKQRKAHSKCNTFFGSSIYRCIINPTFIYIRKMTSFFLASFRFLRSFFIIFGRKVIIRKKDTIFIGMFSVIFNFNVIFYLLSSRRRDSLCSFHCHYKAQSYSKFIITDSNMQIQFNCKHYIYSIKMPK